jgi:hypothetical protein
LRQNNLIRTSTASLLSVLLGTSLTFAQPNTEDPSDQVAEKRDASAEEDGVDAKTPPPTSDEARADGTKKANDSKNPGAQEELEEENDAEAQNPDLETDKEGACSFGEDCPDSDEEFEGTPEGAGSGEEESEGAPSLDEETAAEPETPASEEET